MQALGARVCSPLELCCALMLRRCCLATRLDSARKAVEADLTVRGVSIPPGPGYRKKTLALVLACGILLVLLAAFVIYRLIQRA